MNNVNLLNFDSGIGKIIDNHDIQHMPAAKQMAVTLLKEAELDELFSMQNTQKLLEGMLMPQVGDAQLLRPDIFYRNLNNLIDILGENDNPKIQDLVKNVLTPLQNNKDLLNAYSGLLIGG